MGSAAKMQKILLINPPGKVLVLPDGKPASRKHCFPPIGVAYLAATLREGGYDVSVVDMLAEGYENEYLEGEYVFFGMTIPQLLERIAENVPDVIGISVMFSQKIKECFAIATAIKNRFPEIVILFGGAHVSGAPQETLENPSIDFVIPREADTTIVQFMDYLNGKIDRDDVVNLYYKEDGEIRNTITAKPAVVGQGWEHYKKKDSGVPMDLDALPYPAWDLFPMDRYWDKEVRFAGGDVVTKKYMIMLSSRGCPWACYFCASPTVSGWKAYRKRSVQSILDEIQHFKDMFGIEEIAFNDDNFFVDKKRTKEVVKALGKAFPDTYFGNPGGTEVNALDYEIIDLLAENNFYRINLAIEVGDAELQKVACDKNVPLDRLPELVDYIKSKGLETRAMFIIGIPGETREQRAKTIHLARTLDVDDFYISIATPVRGTELFDEVLIDDLFVDGVNINDIAFGTSTIRMIDDTSPQELEKIRRDVWRESFERRRQKMLKISKTTFSKVG